MQNWPPQSGSCFGGAWGQPRPPAGWGGLGATSDNLARVGGWAGLAFGGYWGRHMVLIRLIESDRNGTCQVGGRRVKK